MNNILNNENINTKLKQVVKTITKDETFTIKDVSVDKMKDGSVGEVYHLYGEGISFDNSIMKFDVILKIIHRWRRFGDPESWNREVKLYKANIFDNFPECTTVPQCYTIDEISNDEVHLWLEYVRGANGDHMTLKDFDAPAYCLGRFHGELDDIPHYTWLSSRYIPMIYAVQWGMESIDWLLKDDSSKIISLDLKESILEIWNYRDNFMRLLLGLPKTLCHRDFNYENVFVDSGKVSIIDWDTAGIGVLGEDIADFTCEALVYKNVSAANAKLIKEQLISNYVKGLKQSNWSGDEGLVRLGYSITVAMHWTFRCLLIIANIKDEVAMNEMLEILEFCLSEAKIANQIIHKSNPI